VIGDAGGGKQLLRALVATLAEEDIEPALVLSPQLATDDQHPSLGRPWVSLSTEPAPSGPWGESRLDVARAVLCAITRARPVRSLLVLVPARDVLDVVQTILEDHTVAHRVALDGVIAALDAATTSTRVASQLPLMRGDEVACLAIADRVAITGSQLLTERGVHLVEQAVTAHAACAQVLVPALRPVRIVDLVGLGAWRGLLAPRRVPSVVDLHATAPLDPGALDRWCDELRDAHPGRPWRMQGVIQLAGDDHPVECVGVRMHLAGRPRRHHAPASISRLCIIGAALDATNLSRSFETAVGR
jgi:hypothetical protein